MARITGLARGHAFQGRVAGREGRTICTFGGQPHVDLRRHQDARSEVASVGSHALVVAGPVAAFVG